MFQIFRKRREGRPAFPRTLIKLTFLQTLPPNPDGSEKLVIGVDRQLLNAMLRLNHWKRATNLDPATVGHGRLPLVAVLRDDLQERTLL